MRTIDELRQQISFERWATRVQVESIAGVREPSTDLRAIAWHVLAAATNWLSRIDGSPPAASLQWVTPGVPEIAPLLDAVERQFADLAAALDDSRLAAPLTYRNQAGAEFRNVLGDVLEHLMLHGAEHRGQIALLVGREGGTPAETEYIWWLRTAVGGAPGR